METYEVTCASCGKQKWPRLPERPKTYICVLCRSVPENVRQKRRQDAKKGAATRRAKS